MSNESVYSNEWNVSAQYFYQTGCYTWMINKLASFNTVLEIGCGTGYSTLALVERGHKVIAIDKNQDCLQKAKKLLSEKGYLNGEVRFFKRDIVVENDRDKLLNDFEYDIVICWNVGTYWDKQMMSFYLPYMLRYGLSREQIIASPESSYSEMIIWNACKLARTKGVPFHLIERGTHAINEQTDPYYFMLRDEFDFSSIEYDNKVANSLSSGGRLLSTQGIVNAESKIDIVFLSIMYR